MVQIEASPQLIGHSINHLNVPGEMIVTSITRNDQAFIPTTGTEVQEGDVIHLAVMSSAMDRLEEMLGLERR